ncbi:MAG TPA: ATP-binding protein [Myxococcota bacterium]|nr:ATP-binding protein [Myxococcota bacterium]
MNPELAELRLQLGLGVPGMRLRLDPGHAPLDVHPGLLDACAVRVQLLGHHDLVPRVHDWENVLPMLRPGEELVWIVETDRPELHVAPRVAVTLMLRFNQSVLPERESLETRRSRFRGIVGQLQRQAFPSSQLQLLRPAECWSLLQSPEGTRGAFVSGVPTPKDLDDERIRKDRAPDARAFQSLNDVVESCLHVRRLRLMFVVGRVTDDDFAAELSRLAALRDAVHAEASVQEARSVTTGENESSQSSDSLAAAQSQREKDPLLRTAWRFVKHLGRGHRRRDLTQAQWEDNPGQLSETRTQSSSSTAGSSRTDGETRTVERLDSLLGLIDSSLDRSLKSLYEARGTGAFRAGAVVLADGSDAALIGDIVKGVLAGSQTKDRPLVSVPLEGATEELLRSNTPILGRLDPALPVLSCERAARFLLLPEAELPGLRMKRGVFLGRNPSPPPSEGRRVRIGPFGFGSWDDTRSDVEITERELFRHVLVAGTTGCGKTSRVLKILEGLRDFGPELRVVVLETAKRTYAGAFSRIRGRPPRVYTIGDATTNPLRINPLFFEPGTSLKRHIAVLSDSLAELLPTEALIGPYMRQAVERCYQDFGWDIETGSFIGEGASQVPGVLDFARGVQLVADDLSYGPEVGANYRGALEGRARIFLDATFQDLFSHGGERSIDEVFPGDTIIEFEELPASELNLPAFITSLLIERIRASQTARQGDRSRPRWLIVIEEAHNVLGRENEGRGAAAEAQGGRTLLRNCVRLLQEGRSLGIGVMVVDQSPAMLARGVIKNTNTKIVMRLEDGEEIAEMGRTLGLSEDSWDDLGLLGVGEAIVKTPAMTRPVRSCAYASVPTQKILEPLKREAPRYGDLERTWQFVLDGRGPPPDGAWLASLREQEGELVDFALGKLLIPDEAPQRFGSWEERLAWARDRHGRVVGQRAGRVLRLVEPVLVAAGTGAPRPEGGLAWPAAAAAAQVLGDGWEDVLGELSASGPGRWEQACSRFRAFAGELPLEPAARVVAARVRLEQDPFVAAEGPPLVLQAAALGLVDGDDATWEWVALRAGAIVLAASGRDISGYLDALPS